jgi:hypothetical protein
LEQPSPVENLSTFIQRRCECKKESFGLEVFGIMLGGFRVPDLISGYYLSVEIHIAVIFPLSNNASQ